MRLSAQTPPWHDRLATLQEGYRYPWQSILPAWYGEDAYLELVRQHVRSDTDVLDAACAHGEVSLEIAPQAQSVLGFDRTAAWIELAQRTARERGITNASFVRHDSSADANGGRARIPTDDASFDVLIRSAVPRANRSRHQYTVPGGLPRMFGSICNYGTYVQERKP